MSETVNEKIEKAIAELEESVKSRMRAEIEAESHEKSPITLKPKVNILGTEYEILLNFATEDKYLNNCDGYCDNHANKIVVRDYTEQEREEDGMTCDLDSYIKKCIRHEIIHAFIYQSGLSINSMKYQGSWSENEEMIDWIAIQSPKIYKIFQECNCL